MGFVHLCSTVCIAAFFTMLFLESTCGIYVLCPSFAFCLPGCLSVSLSFSLSMNLCHRRLSLPAQKRKLKEDFHIGHLSDYNWYIYRLFFFKYSVLLLCLLRCSIHKKCENCKLWGHNIMHLMELFLLPQPTCFVFDCEVFFFFEQGFKVLLYCQWNV